MPAWAGCIETIIDIEESISIVTTEEYRLGTITLEELITAEAMQGFPEMIPEEEIAWRTVPAIRYKDKELNLEMIEAILIESQIIM